MELSPQGLGPQRWYGILISSTTPSIIIPTEVGACLTPWKYSVLTWVSHTLTSAVTVCSKCSVILSSVLSIIPFILTSWSVLALQRYVKLYQTFLHKNKKGHKKKLIISNQGVLSYQSSSPCNQHDCPDTWIDTCSGAGLPQGNLSDTHQCSHLLDSSY